MAAVVVLVVFSIRTSDDAAGNRSNNSSLGVPTSLAEEFAVVATSRRLPSDTGAFADWIAFSSSSAAAGGGGRATEDLSLGFNAGPTSGVGVGANVSISVTGAGSGGIWSHSAATTRHHQINYGLSPDMGILGLRDVFVVAPASSCYHNNQHHHHGEPILSDPHSINASNAATALGVGVIPLLTATPCYANTQNITEEDMLSRSRNTNSNITSSGGIQFWQQAQQPQPQNSIYYKKSSATVFDPHHNTASTAALLGGSGIGGGSGTTTSCQDCGNQAKKDCTHRRCRTCCKSRGYDCATHEKSTWVPAARRRERQLMGATGGATTGGSSGSTSGNKKLKITSQTTTTSHTSTSNTTPRSYDTSSSHQDAGLKEALPGQVRAPAVFRCVRVTAVEDGDDEYAYQAVVKIGGHVFKGFLYDQGTESNREAFPNMSELHLGGGGGSGGATTSGRNVDSSSAPILDPSNLYATGGGGGGLLGSSTYGNTIN